MGRTPIFNWPEVRELVYQWYIEEGIPIRDIRELLQVHWRLNTVDAAPSERQIKRQIDTWGFKIKDQSFEVQQTTTAIRES